jgi:hypothetical protein
LQPGRFLIPGRDKHKSIEPTVLHTACRSARAAAGIDSPLDRLLLQVTPPD